MSGAVVERTLEEVLAEAGSYDGTGLLVLKKSMVHTSARESAILPRWVNERCFQHMLPEGRGKLPQAMLAHMKRVGKWSTFEWERSFSFEEIAPFVEAGWIKVEGGECEFTYEFVRSSTLFSDVHP